MPYHYTPYALVLSNPILEGNACCFKRNVKAQSELNLLPYKYVHKRVYLQYNKTLRTVLMYKNIHRAIKVLALS